MSRDHWANYSRSAPTPEEHARDRWVADEWMEFRDTAKNIKAGQRFLPYLLALMVGCVGLGVYLASTGALAGGS